MKKDWKMLKKLKEKNKMEKKNIGLKFENVVSKQNSENY